MKSFDTYDIIILKLNEIKITNQRTQNCMPNKITYMCDLITAWIRNTPLQKPANKGESVFDSLKHVKVDIG